MEHDASARAASPARKIAIGGLGGSGTRVGALAIRELGYAFAPGTERQCDTWWYTLLFKYREAFDLPDRRFAQLYDILNRAMFGIGVEALAPALQKNLLSADRAGQHDRDWLQARIDSLAHAGDSARPHWVWKEPNTHILADRFLALDPELFYVHVMRNGPDMAFSGNQNQLRLWGPLVFKDSYEDSPRGALCFWNWAHERVAKLRQRYPERVFVLGFEQICRNPSATVERLATFLGCTPDAAAIAAATACVRPPETIGRHVDRIGDLDADECERARALQRQLLAPEGLFKPA